MIGVLAIPSEHAVVGEFFELFKTPWEFFRADHSYEVLVCAGDHEYPRGGAIPILIYSGHATRHEGTQETTVAYQAMGTRMFSYRGFQMPIYGESLGFITGDNLLTDQESGRPVIRSACSAGRIHRIGYDLFWETRLLLTAGQPASNAGIPTLDLHINLLRDLMIASGVRFVEIPPVPFGFEFLSCLSHDMDHPSLRLHRFDPTMCGFLYRATAGSLRNLARGRLSVRHLLRNWAAAVKLPLILIGAAKDIWREYARYVQIEGDAPSSFFVVPFRNQPGRRRTEVAPKRRAAAYGVADVAVEVRQLLALGCEIGVHGIDAWLDRTSAEKELDEVRRVTNTEKIGVRMHWLYFDEHSVEALEAAGADYDSSVGYNETIGYRAGTSQAYRPISATRLMELPLHIMDTALFYPSYLDLSASEAAEKIRVILDNAARLGGCVTVNWHDRSIAPERLWGDTYADLVGEMRRRGAWFATAAHVVAWFRKRRAARFYSVRWNAGQLHVQVGVDAGDDLPALQLRTYDGHTNVGKIELIPTEKIVGGEPAGARVAELALPGRGGQ